MFWATLWIPIPQKPPDPVAMFGYLEKFTMLMLEEDTHFTIFPYNLSKFKSSKDLLEPIKNSDMLQDDVDKWLQYFPQPHP